MAQHTYFMNVNCVPCQVTFDVDLDGNFEIQKIRRLNQPTNDNVLDIVSERDADDLVLEIEALYHQQTEEMAL